MQLLKNFSREIFDFNILRYPADKCSSDSHLRRRPTSDKKSAAEEIEVLADGVLGEPREVGTVGHRVGLGDGGDQVEGADGAVLATSAIPPLAAPTDLRPRTATIRIAAPAKATSVEIALPGDAPEVTRLNNRVALEPTR